MIVLYSMEFLADRTQVTIELLAWCHLSVRL